MENISFDNPYLLLLAIPVALAILVPFFIVRNKDNKTLLWTISVIAHIAIIIVVALAIAGLSTETVLTKTTVYVVADVSYSADRNLDEIDEKINEIKENLPENSKLGVVCFGKNVTLLNQAGRKLKSVKEAKVDDSATDIVKALNYTEGLFPDDTLKRIVLITDGNDTSNNSSGSIASAVSRITENGIKVDAIFLDSTVGEDETEVQLLEPEYSTTAYANQTNQAKFLAQISCNTNMVFELYSRPYTVDGTEEYTLVGSTVLTVEAGLVPITMELPTDQAGEYEYKATVVTEGDYSSYNNTRTFTQTVVGKEKILLLTGNPSDQYFIENIYNERAEISSYVISGSGTKVPFTIEELIVFDEIIISNLDIRNIRNVNAFVDTLDIVVSQYGKSLTTMGDLQIQTNSDDPIFQKFEELLPVNYGSTGRDGKLYTILLDVSQSMFMASKHTIAKQSAIQLISVLEDDDYICLITFSGDIRVETPRKVKDCKDELINSISSLEFAHGTDIGLGLEEALKTIRALNLVENQIMIISDGFSFDSKVVAKDVAKELVEEGAVISAINTYIASDGKGNGSHEGYEILQGLVDVNTSGKGKCYKVSTPEAVSGLIFGTVANDVGDVIIEKEAQVNIVKNNDKVVSGLYGGFPYISKFVVSLEKYDATVPLTLTYKKDNGYQETVPFYAYRSHGNGKVASFTSSLSGEWAKNWSADDREKLMVNMLESSTPAQRIDYPFTVNVERTDYDAYFEIVPSILDYSAVTKLKITNPKGRTITRTLTFDSTKYSYSLQTPDAGTYRIDISYSYEDSSFETSVVFEIPYLPEYNAFASYDKFKVYEFMRDNGSVVVDGIPNLENDKSEITTYKVSFVIPLLISAVVIFVFDVLIRKLKFKKRGKPKKKVTVN